MHSALNRGDRFVVLMTDVDFGGDGVGRRGDLVIFVPFTVDGDEAEVEVADVKQRYARGRLVRIITPSPYRAPAPCTYYGRCGGCRMQHIAYGHQLELKRRQVAETFARIAKIPRPTVEPVIPSPLSLAYRGKAEFHLAGDSARRAGLMAPASRDLIEVERCAIVEETINRKYGNFREALRHGFVNLPGDRIVIWSDEPGEAPTEVAGGFEKLPDVTRIVLGKRITVPYDGFFQANGALTGELVAQVVAMSRLSGRETVVDAYGGSGLFSLFLGPRAARLYGIEGDRDAVRCAGINLDREGLTQATFFRGDVAEIIARELAPRRVTADVVVLDPPRDGCGGEALAGVAALRPERIVYVSCNPATQARDCRRLSEYGYALRSLQPLDMFPQTAHIEVVALLTPVTAGEGGA